MTGHFTIFAIPTSSILVIAATTAALIALWLPLNDFPATYTYQRAPNLLYTYASGSATASCSATERFNNVLYEYTCRGGTSALPTGTSSASINPRSLSLPFYLTSYVARSTIVPEGAYGYQYPPTATPTITSGAATRTVTGPSRSTSRSALQYSESGYAESASSSRAAASSYLAGAVISQITFAPTPTVYDIHIPHPKLGTRVLMTVYCSLALAISLFIFLQSAINFVIALYLLNRTDNEQPTLSSPEPEKTIDSRFIFSIRSQEDEQEASSVVKEPESNVMAAWNSVPPRAVTGAWLVFTIPCLVVGLISIAVQGSNLKDLPGFLAAGACGKTISYYSTWEQLICSGDRPSRLPGTLTPASTNRPTNMQTYAWPLTVSLAMFVVAWVSLLFLFFSVLIRLKVSRRQSAGAVSLNRSDRNFCQGASAGAIPFFTFAAFGDGGGGYGGGGDGGGGGFGGGGFGGGGGGDGGGGGGGGCT